MNLKQAFETARQFALPSGQNRPVLEFVYFEHTKNEGNIFKCVACDGYKAIKLYCHVNLDTSLRFAIHGQVDINGLKEISEGLLKFESYDIDQSGFSLSTLVEIDDVFNRDNLKPAVLLNSKYIGDLGAIGGIVDIYYDVVGNRIISHNRETNGSVVVMGCNR